MSFTTTALGRDILEEAAKKGGLEVKAMLEVVVATRRFESALQKQFVGVRRAGGCWKGWGGVGW